MSAIPTLLLIAALADMPVDPAELAKAQSALESYLGRIQSLRISYTEQWTPPPIAPKSRDPLEDPKVRESRVWDPNLRNNCELLYAYPSMRMLTVERHKDREGTITEHKRETAIHQGKITAINYRAKDFYTSTKKANPFPILAIDPIGLRTLHTANTPVSDFLRFPDITSLEGEDVIDGERVIVLRIGPGIPSTTRAPGWDAKAFVRLSLARDRNYLPLRTDITSGGPKHPERRFTMDLGSFKAVQDEAAGEPMDFPHRAVLTQPNGSTVSWIVQSAIINPPVTERDFVLTPPNFSAPDESSRQTLGAEAKERSKRTEERAAAKLGAVGPPSSSPGNSARLALPIGIAAVALVVLACAFCYYRFGRR